MFNNETLFILGAGASIPYGYPSGSDLIRKIVENIYHDEIILPIPPHPEAGFWANPRKFNFYISGINTYDTSVLDTPSIGPIKDQFQHKSQLYGRVKLNNIDSFNVLRQNLIDFDPVSIDGYLNHNPTQEAAGKIMIIYSLLKCEDRTKFCRNDSANNWYSYLLNDLLSGCKSGKDILNNNLNIITFNYSLDLEYCILTKLRNTEFIKNSNINDRVDEFFKQRIHHVYGRIYDEDLLESYGNHSSSNNSIQLHTKRFLKAYNSQNSIDLIDRARCKNETLKELIQAAKEIIIIGFGFDRDNLDLIGFPNQMAEYPVFFNGKNVKFMDYDGKMRGLRDQFSNIPPSVNKRTITASIAKNIVDSYQNDFKLRLYE